MIYFLFVILGSASLGRVHFVITEKESYPGIAIRVEATAYGIYRLESEVTKPIEKSLSSVGGIEEIRSVTEDGLVEIHLLLKQGQDVRRKAAEIRERLDRVSSRFAREIHKPQVFPFDPHETPSFVLSFHDKDLGKDDLREYIEKHYKPKIESIEGVSFVLVTGGHIQEILIEVDPKQMEAYELGLKDLSDQIQSQLKSRSLGAIGKHSENLPLYQSSLVQNVYDLNFIPLPSGRGTVSELAEIKTHPREENRGARRNGKDLVSLFIFKKDSADLNLIFTSLESILPKEGIGSLQFEFLEDESKRIRSYQRTFIAGILCILFLLGLREILWNHSLNRLFLYCLSLYASYAILHFCLFLFQMCLSHAILIGMCFGFLLGLALEDLIPKKRQRFSLFSTGGLLFCFCLTSFLVSDLFGRIQTSTYFATSLSFCIFQINSQLFSKEIKFRSILGFGNMVRNVRYRIYKRFFHFEKKIRRGLKIHPKLPLLCIISLPLLAVYTILTKPIFLPETNSQDRLLAVLEFPSGTSFAHTNQVSETIEKAITEFSFIEQVVSKIEMGHVLLLIRPKPGLVINAEWVNVFKESLGDTEDASIFFLTESASPFAKDLVIDVLGEDETILQKLCEELAKKAKENQYVTEVMLKYKPNREELLLHPKANSMLVSSVDMSSLGHELRTALQGVVVGKFRSPEKEMDIRIRFQERYRQSKESLSEIRLKTGNGKYSPLETLVTSSTHTIPQKIYHKNQIRNLSFALRFSSTSGSKEEAKVFTQLQSYPLPESYRLEVSRDEVNKNSRLREITFHLLIPFLLFALGKQSSLLIPIQYFVLFLMTSHLYPTGFSQIQNGGLVFAHIFVHSSGMRNYQETIVYRQMLLISSFLLLAPSELSDLFYLSLSICLSIFIKRAFFGVYRSISPKVQMLQGVQNTLRAQIWFRLGKIF